MCYVIVAKAMLKFVKDILAVPDIHGCRHSADHLQVVIDKICCKTSLSYICI